MKHRNELLDSKEKCVFQYSVIITSDRGSHMKMLHPKQKIVLLPVSTVTRERDRDKQREKEKGNAVCIQYLTKCAFRVAQLTSDEKLPIKELPRGERTQVPGSHMKNHERTRTQSTRANIHTRHLVSRREWSAGPLHLVRDAPRHGDVARGERILAGVVYVVSTRDTMGKDNQRLIGSLRAKVYAPGQKKIAPGFPTSSTSTCNLAMQARLVNVRWLDRLTLSDESRDWTFYVCGSFDSVAKNASEYSY